MNDTYEQSISTARALNVAEAGPLPSRAPRVWAGSILLAAGLGLIVLAGCFLIGAIMLMVDPEMQGNGGLAQVLFFVLMLIALSCLAGAVILFFFAARGLLRIMYE